MAKEKKQKENTAENANTPVEEKKQASYRFQENTDRKKSREKKKALEEKYAVKKLTGKNIAIIVLVCLVAVGIIAAGVCLGTTGILSFAKVGRSGEDVDIGGGGGGESGHGGDIVHDVAYTVSFASDAGTGKAPASFTKCENEKFRLPLCSFEFDGYEFTYWEFDGQYYKANAEFTMPGKNVTFKAVWIKTHDTGFEFELNANGTAYYLKGIGTCTAANVMLPAKHGGDNLPVIKILDGAFANCNFKSVQIPEGILEIESNAFRDCINLEAVALPSTIHTVGESAFFGCEKLAEVGATDTLVYLGKNAFHDTAWYDNQPDGQVYVEKVFYTVKGTCDKTLTLKSDTIAIASFALENRSTVEKVVIPSLVQYIPGNFVSNCNNLSSFAVNNQNVTYSTNGNAIILTNEKAIAVGCKATVIPTDGSVDKIWKDAFYGCAALTSIDIPENVTVICEKAFYGSGLINVDVHKNMQTIKGGAFDNLASLTTINFNAVNCNADEKCCDYKDFVGCKKGVVVNVGKDVEVINGGIFSGSDSIASVKFASDCKVSTLGRNAFKGCYNSSFARFDIPSSITTLETGCFADTQMSNTGLTWLIIPTTVTTIEEGFVTSTSGTKRIFCYSAQDNAPVGWEQDWDVSAKTGEHCQVYWDGQWWLNGGVPMPLEI